MKGIATLIARSGIEIIKTTTIAAGIKIKEAQENEIILIIPTTINMTMPGIMKYRNDTKKDHG